MKRQCAGDAHGPESPCEPQCDLPNGSDRRPQRWTKAEQRIVTAIAQLGGDEVVTRSAIERAVDSDISTYRARLLDKAVVEDVDRGQLRFTLPGFADFVLAETDGGPTTAGQPSRGRHERRQQPPEAGGPPRAPRR